MVISPKESLCRASASLKKMTDAELAQSVVITHHFNWTFQAYQQLKREMETKQRNKVKAAQEEQEKPQEVIYVDRDRAAAVQVLEYCPFTEIYKQRDI